MEEIVFEVMGEGGGVKLVGRRRPGGEGWEFRRVINEMSYADYGVDDEDARPAPAPAPHVGPRPIPAARPKVPPPTAKPHESFEWVGTWAEALALMDRNPWAMLHPKSVHPEFREELLVEATRRLMEQPPGTSNGAMGRWLKVCGG